ncbi:MAG: Trk system potassium transporter TrkA [Clostridia bacterium]|nr:Trk system potassium transporter TrkA [Clostridia bacterium]
MKIIIVGCGKVGRSLAAKLNEEGHDVVVVDQNREKVTDVCNKYDILGVIGNGATREVQMEAGIDSADLLIAVTGSDELNLLSCVMAKKKGNCHTVARVKNPVYATDASYLRDELGLNMVINPEYAAAKEISSILSFPTAINIESFAKGRVELLTFKLPQASPLIGLSVKEAVSKYKLKNKVLFCAVERAEEANIPHGDFMFAERDLISIIASPKSALDFFSKIDYRIQPVKNAIAVGSGNLVHYLCERLIGSGVNLTVIDDNEKECEELSVKYGEVKVVKATPSDKDTLMEEGIENSDAFISLTEQDEENILLSLFAAEKGTKKLVTKINKPEYDGIIQKLELGSLIYPASITTNMITRYIRAMSNTLGSNMEALYYIVKGKVEAAQFTVGEGSPISGVPLSSLKFKSGVLIAAILRGRSLIIPTGDAVINPHDSVIVVSKQQKLYDVSDVLAK